MMLVLDTNVLSELMKVKPNPQVIAWLDAQSTGSVWTTSVSVFEISFGLSALPDGKRKRALQDAFDAMLTENLEHHVLALDQASAIRAVKFRQCCMVSVVLWKYVTYKSLGLYRFATRSWQLAISNTFRIRVSRSSALGTKAVSEISAR